MDLPEFGESSMALYSEVFSEVTLQRLVYDDTALRCAEFRELRDRIICGPLENRFVECERECGVAFYDLMSVVEKHLMTKVYDFTCLLPYTDYDEDTVVNLCPEFAAAVNLNSTDGERYIIETYATTEYIDINFEEFMTLGRHLGSRDFSAELALLGVKEPYERFLRNFVEIERILSSDAIANSHGRDAMEEFLTTALHLRYLISYTLTSGSGLKRDYIDGPCLKSAQFVCEFIREDVILKRMTEYSSARLSFSDLLDAVEQYMQILVSTGEYKAGTFFDSMSNDRDVYLSYMLQLRSHPDFAVFETEALTVSCTSQELIFRVENFTYSMDPDDKEYQEMYEQTDQYKASSDLVDNLLDDDYDFTSWQSWWPEHVNLEDVDRMIKVWDNYESRCKLDQLSLLPLFDQMLSARIKMSDREERIAACFPEDYLKHFYFFRERMTYYIRHMADGRRSKYFTKTEEPDSGKAGDSVSQS